ncbi:hypothetical protein [Nocardioides marmoribigeumensis]|uniref:ABC-type Na+ efflux pump permease subunit n=1 Tax=Nocardioides marmoribigeumensis TaxID=433649 RepID=A0ABU2C0R2_9ACTN|nr:hypothetical protein [Nocardioides marmoribigeumensis]MDR7364220.1 ABC-type Na+ efflux pump permease subunit [Nocardioides marmoribigeumensis]
MTTSTFRRDVAATSLVVTAVLSAVSTATAPEFPSGYTDRLAAIDQAGALSWVSALTFTLAQLPFLVAVLGVGHLLRDEASRLSVVGVCLASVGAFGHAVFGGVSLVSVVMAQDAATRSTSAALLADVEGSPVMLFAAMGLLGTVFGLLVLAAALWRTQVAPRWVPVLVAAFLVVEFVGGNLASWAPQLSAVLYLVAFGALARTVHAQATDDAASRTGLGHDVPAPAVPA